MNLPTSDYVKIANDYVEGVLSGAIPACQFVKLACLRQRDDLKNFSGEDSPYYFDKNTAERVCRFIELLPHTKGSLAGTPIHLEPWQVFILTTTFGWLRKEDGGRRFRRVYIEVPRGNGKSSISSGVALYCLLADHELGAEVYSFATTRDQAKIVFDDAKVMAQRTPALRNRFGLEVLAHSLFVPSTNSRFMAKSHEGKTLDGLNTHLAIIDELHAHKTREVYDVVETSLGKRKSSLLWCITTAGFDEQGVCFEVRTMVRKVLEKTVIDATQFGIIYTIDEGDDWTKEETLAKANPNWGVSVRPEMVTSLQKKAIVLASAKPNFLTKHLNVWCKAMNQWMDMGKWDACCVEGLSLEEFYGRECYIGLDLAAKNDIAAKVYLFPMDDGRYAVFGKYYLPEIAVSTSPNASYAGWVEDGYLTVTSEAITDLNRIEDDLRDDMVDFEVKAIAYDPWQATQLATTLSDEGAPMVEYRNTVQNFSDPMKTLEAMVQGGLIVHDGNPVLTWMMSNVVARVDAKENVFPRKAEGKRENKIDGVVATIMALGMTKQETTSFESYEDGENPFANFEW